MGTVGQIKALRSGDFYKTDRCIEISVTSKKLPNAYKSYPKMISQEKLKNLTPLQKVPKNEGDLGKLIMA